MAIAVVLGLWSLGTQSLWLDEAFSVAAARLPTADLLALLWTSEMHASPYYLSLHVWLWFGDGEAVVRALSVAFGALAVFATFHVGKRYGVGWPAALILAVFPYFIQYEQEARTYTMFVAGSAISSLLYLRLVERWGIARAIAYVVAAALMIYIHPLAAMVVVAHAIHLLLVVRRPLPQALAVYATVGLCWLPMVRFAMSHSGKIAWIPPTDVDRSVNALLYLGGGSLVAGVLLVMLALGMRRDLPALWLIVPIVGVFVMSVLVQPVLEPKYMLGVLPAAAVIAARNRPAAIGVLVALSLVGVVNWYEHGQKADWRSAAAWVASDVQAGDGVVFAPTYMRMAFGYYARVGDPLHAARSWSAPDIGGGPTDLAGIHGRQRLWLVEGHGRELPDDVRTALAVFRVVETRDFGGAAVRVSLLEQ